MATHPDSPAPSRLERWRRSPVVHVLEHVIRLAVIGSATVAVVHKVRAFDAWAGDTDCGCLPPPDVELEVKIAGDDAAAPAGGEFSLEVPAHLSERDQVAGWSPVTDPELHDLGGGVVAVDHGAPGGYETPEIDAEDAGDGASS